jgi:D-alanine-D-alanine ligase
MRIAFTHNMKITQNEDEAEFDTAETIQALTAALENLGYKTYPLEVSGPVSKVIAQLEALEPDLIFNTAEGKLGRYREAFYPGVFEQLGIPFTGSDAYVCTLSLDKNLTKQTLEGHGILLPQSILVRSLQEFRPGPLRFPLILKPNFEGSSKGITQESVVGTAAEAEALLKKLLPRFKDGILVEEYIEGRDVTVPILEAHANEFGGVLEPAEYVFDLDPVMQAQRKFQIYDYELKNHRSELVSVRVPAEIAAPLAQDLRQDCQKIFKILGLRDLARMDFRLTPDGKLYFIEVNALPSLEPGASLYTAAERAGLKSVESVLDLVIHSAVKRHGIKNTKVPVRKNRRSLRVGFTFNQKRVNPEENDVEAEFDSPTTLNAIRTSIQKLGHEVVDFEATSDIVSRISVADIDVVFNIAEGFRGRNRESQIPATLELLDIPYTGSDPATLALALDKGLAKKVVMAANVPTARSQTLMTGKEKISGLEYPLILKPVAEGSSKGVLNSSVVENEEELRNVARELILRYRQPVLVEEFLPGREFTVGLLGEYRPRVLEPMEIVFTKAEKNPVYSFQDKQDFNDRIRYDVPAKIEPDLRKKLERFAIAAFKALGCRDVARIDFRCDRNGVPHFIECNPLPGLTPGWSDLCMIAAASGLNYDSLIAEILAPAIRRWKEKKKFSLHVGGVV